MPRAAPCGQEVTVESGQVSGKVFRFLSTMHPSLSKKERAKYGELQPESWYPWTDELAAEFADLMKRSPRDTAFARGFAYVAQKGIPDGTYVAPADLIDHIDRLPGAFRGPEGSGYAAERGGAREARVSFRGLPGMNNACIAVVGELTQRLQAAGAAGVEVKHVSPCRLQGAEECSFEVSWASESVPSGQKPVDLDSVLGDSSAADRKVIVTESPAQAPPAPEPAPRPAAAARPAEPAPAARPAAPPRPAPSLSPAPAAPAAAPPAAPAMTESEVRAATHSQDLFEQLRVRLLEAEAQSSRHSQLEAEIERLTTELARLREEAERALAAAMAETEGVRDELYELKRRIRELVGDG
jgi:hypothetical protein